MEVLTNDIVSELVLDYQLKWTYHSLPVWRRELRLHHPPLFTGTEFDALLDNVGREFMFRIVDKLIGHQRDKPIAIFWRALFDDMLCNVVAELVRDEVARVGIKVPHQLLLFFRCAAFQHSLDHATAVDMRRKLVGELATEGVHNVGHDLPREHFDHLLDDVVPMNILGDFGDSRLQLLYHLGLLFNQDMFQSLSRD